MNRSLLATLLLSAPLACGSLAQQPAPASEPKQESQPAAKPESQPEAEKPVESATPDAAETSDTKLDTSQNFKFGIPDISLPSLNQPGDVGLSPGDTPTASPDELNDIRIQRRGLFHLPLIEDPIDNLVAALRRLEDKTGLRLSFAYTMLFQQTTNTPVGPNNGGAGDIDFMAAWTLLGRGTENAGTLVATTEYRFQIGDQPPSFLGRQLGTLTNVTGAFNDRGWVVRDVFWLQRLLEGRLRFLVGRADISDYMGGTRMQAINTSFFNRAFSANASVAFPAGHGPAAGVSIVPNNLFYVTAGVQNGYSTSTTAGFNTLGDGDFFYGIEAGLTPRFEGLGQGRYRVMLWHMAERPLLNLPSDQGISLIADQDFGERFVAFARYSHSEADLTDILNAGQIGMGVRGLLGSPDDFSGLAAGISEPPGSGRRDEKVFEVFHRWQLTNRSQFTVGAQLIIDPSNAPNDDTLGVFSFRYRVDF